MSESAHALHARFRRGLALRADHPALQLPDRAVTYRELDETARTWAGSLLAAAPSPGAVAVVAAKGFEAYAGILAALFAGATVVPISPDFPASRIGAMLDLAGVGVVIADAKGRVAVAATGRDVPMLNVDGHAIDGIAVSTAAALDRPRDVAPADVAYLLFTSGSTGRPKGVRITHAMTKHYFDLIDERYDFGPEDAFSQTFDTNFDCAMFDLHCAWGAGGTLVVPPPTAYRDMPAFVAAHGITVWFSTPSAIALLRRMGGLGAGSMPSLRWAFFAGEALRCSDVVDFAVAAPDAIVENLYGPTELTITITGHRWDALGSPQLAVNGLMPIGEVHPGHTYLLDTDTDGDGDPDEGELCISGPQLTPGYLDPADDEGRFFERDGHRWYRTGDRVRRRPDGTLVYVGRLDSQVQVQGWRVELAEVDQALRGADGVEDAVTVTRPVDGSVELVVYYTGTETSPAVLARQLRDMLPAGMLPRRYEHVPQFPLNSNRKIDRRELATRAAAVVG